MTSGDVLRRLGRWVLWGLVVVLLIRGTAALFEREQSAGAFGLRGPWRRRGRMTGAGVRGGLRARVPELLARGPGGLSGCGASVRGAGAGELGRAGVRRGRVAPRGRVGVGGAGRASRRCARAGHGGRGDDDGRDSLRDGPGRAGLRAVAWSCRSLPSLAAPPARASVPASSLESVPARERGAIEDVVRRFLSAYLAGDAGALAYLAPSGVRIGALGAGARARRRGVAGAAGAGRGPLSCGAGHGPRSRCGGRRSTRWPTGSSWCASSAGWWRRSIRRSEGRLRDDAQVRADRVR